MQVIFDFLNNFQPLISKIQDGAISLGIRILISAVTLFIGFIVIQWIRRIVKKFMKNMNIESGTAGFLSSLITVLLYVVLAFMIASAFGVDAASVLAVLGSAGVTIGLAIQGSLSNLAGGILIIFLKPFKVGDFIHEDNKGNEGTVTNISLFYTTLQTIDERTVILPNGTLANTSLTNVSYTPKRLLEVKFHITYDANWKLAIKILEEVLLSESANYAKEATETYLSDLTSEGVCIGGRCYLHNGEYRFAKQRIMYEIKDRFDAENISFAYPYIKIFQDKEETKK